MAQSKFKLNAKEEDGITHAHTQTTKVKSPNPTSNPTEEESCKLFQFAFKVSSSVDLGVNLIKLFEILTPIQKKQFVEYAKKDDRTASCVIKELLIKEGIIEDDI